MSEDLKQAKKNTKKKSHISTVWLIPLIAVLIGGWLLYQNIRLQGPTITIELNNAEGLEAGKTKVKIRSVDVGTLEELRLSNDYDNVIAKVQMQPNLNELLVEDTQFWVVKPRVGRQGVSGLGTILSGTYIQMRPGKADKSAKRFKVLNRPPPTRPNIPGLSLSLTSESVNTLSIGDPIIFQGLTVGQVETVDLDIEDLYVSYRIFIESPYNKLVTQNTKFWPRSGIDFQISSEGVDVQIGNLQAILAGGLTFGVPEGVNAGAKVENGTHFKLYSSYKKVLNDRYDEKIEYVVLFDDSVRYLYKGAAVEFHGIRVGTVAQVPFLNKNFSIDQIRGLRIPVLINLEPQRISNITEDLSMDEWKQLLSKQFDEGLRATLKSANLLTGAKFVDLVFNKNPEVIEPKTLGSYPIFPSQPGGFATLEQQVEQLLSKLNNLPVESLMAELESTLKQTEETIKSFNSILNDDVIKAIPADLQKTLTELQYTINSYREGEPIYNNINQTLKELQRLMSDLGALTQTLKANPNAIIFGNDKEKDPIPKAAE